MPTQNALPRIEARETLDDRVEAACEQACRNIAPAWPLDRAIAVNPHWARVARPVREVAARMAVLGDIRVFPPRAYLREAWEAKRVDERDLAEALAELPAARSLGLTPSKCVASLEREAPVAQLPLLIDVLDDDPARHARLTWRQAITHQVSQTCAAYFDERQADWQPGRREGLYAFWRDTLAHDHGIGVLMGLPDLGRRLAALPLTRQEAERWVLRRLGLPEAAWADYLEAVLLTVNGWASWCAYLGWQAAQEGRRDEHLRDLLAIRLAWGAILLECKDDAAARRAFAALLAAWSDADAHLRLAEASLVVDEVWQRALEIGITIAGGADIILLDEPTAGMSRSETEHATDLIRNVTQGKTLVMVEHDMGVVFDLADRISVLVYGQVLATDSPALIRANPAVQEAYLGTAVAAEH